MKRNALVLLIFMGFLQACSDERGRLVDKPQNAGGGETAPEPADPGAMPEGHPPISGDGGGMGGGMMGMGMGMGGPGTPPEIDGTTVTASGLKFEIDPAWTSETPSSGMRAAQFSVPAPEGGGEPAELVLFQGIGGSAQANIDRWIGQFSGPGSDAAKQEHLDVGDFHVDVLDIQGTYDSGMMMGGGPKESQRMLAAVIEGPGGPWHLRLTGDIESVTPWEDEFRKLLETLEPAG